MQSSRIYKIGHSQLFYSSEPLKYFCVNNFLFKLRPLNKAVYRIPDFSIIHITADKMLFFILFHQNSIKLPKMLPKRSLYVNLL